jgi:fumarylacetoacetate (FAA) hydrolase
MTFDFVQLVAHASKTRACGWNSYWLRNSCKPGSISSSCLAEVRCLEIIKDGKAYSIYEFWRQIEVK